MDNLKNLAANMVYGRDFPAIGTCVCHGKSVTEADFRDEISRREYAISRLCQETQDDIFRPYDEE